MIGQRVVLRPRSLLETGDLATALVRRHAGPFLRLLPWVALPAAALWVAHRLQVLPAPLVWVALPPVTALASGVYTVLCGDLMLNEQVDLRSVQARWIRRAVPASLVRAATWVLLGITGGLALAWTAFAPEVALLERGALRAALSRTGALMRTAPGRWLGWACVSALAVGVAVLAGRACESGVRSMLALPPPVPFDPGEDVPLSVLAGFVVVQPYLAALRFLLYVDCRTRREGWDLQVTMNALASTREPA